jgi:hypothetical protein
MIEQAFAGRRELDAAAAALEEDDAKRFLEAPDPGAGGCEREMGAVGAAGDAAAVGNRDEKLQIDQVEAHRFLKKSPAFGMDEGWLRNLHKNGSAASSAWSQV